MCLQEVQSNHYEDYFKEMLEYHGYEGVYKRKTNELFMGKCSATDGCATFYKKSRFTLIKKYEVEFNKAAVTTANSYREPTRSVALQRLSKDNVALIVVLESRQPMNNGQGQLVCVANTHIHSNPENSDIKVWQVHTLLKGLEKIASSAKIPIIVSGDFNSEPGSAAHSLLVNRSIDQRHPEASHDPAQLLQNMLPVQHTLPLCSAYSAFLYSATYSDNPEIAKQRSRMDAVTREPLFTNYTKTYKGTLDYIFYTPELLTPTALLELPSEEEAEIENGIPNARYSSDHICIMAEFQVK
jgi:CCR4-NOT transcription complex subunit 6